MSTKPPADPNVTYVRKFQLNNRNLLRVSIQFRFRKNGDSEWQLSKTSRPIRFLRTLTIAPGLLGVPDDHQIQLIAITGKQTFADEILMFDDERSAVAYYTFNSNRSLTLDNVQIALWANWSHNVEYESPNGTYFYPHNVQDLRDILARANNSSGVVVRVSGQRHSQPALVVGRESTRTWLIDMSCYADLGPEGTASMVMTDGGNTISVNSGVREDELDAFVTYRNKILPTVTAGGIFSVGGMTMVDVHGSSIYEPIFAETATAFNIMGPDGFITTYRRPEPDNRDDDFYNACVSFGMLGVVTSVTIRLIDRPYQNSLVPELLEVDFENEDECVAALLPIVEAKERLEVFWNPYSGNALALTWKMEEPEEGIPNENLDVVNACELADDGMYGAPYEGVFEVAAQAFAKWIQDSRSTTAASDFVGVALFNIREMFAEASVHCSDLWLTKAARTMFMAYFIELPKLDAAGMKIAWKALEVIQTELQSEDFLLGTPIEFRFIKGGKAGLAGTYTASDEDTYFVNYTMIGFADKVAGKDYSENMKKFFSTVERAWVEMGGQPHSGKMFAFYDPDGAADNTDGPFNESFLRKWGATRQNRLDSFEKLRAKVDPNGLFYNDYCKMMLNQTME